MAQGSTKVLFATLIGNVLEALAKFGAAYLSGSSAMLSEAFHSSANSANPILLLIGNKRSQAAPDRTHPFGYGGAVYFWTFVVAVMVFLAGGVASIYEGVLQLRSPEAMTWPWLSLGVLAASAVFELYSFAYAYREYKRVASSHAKDGELVGLWRFIKLSKDPNLYETLLEDWGTLAGLAVAALGVIGNAMLGLRWADGIASLLIGLLQIGVSLMIARATGSLIAGEGVAPGVLQDLQRAVARGGTPEVRDLATLHLGPRQILVALTLEFDGGESVAEAEREMKRLQERLEAVDDRIAYVYFRFE